jgi:hypothetical protein
MGGCRVVWLVASPTSNAEGRPFILDFVFFYLLWEFISEQQHVHKKGQLFFNNGLI